MILAAARLVEEFARHLGEAEGVRGPSIAVKVLSQMEEVLKWEEQMLKGLARVLCPLKWGPLDSLIDLNGIGCRPPNRPHRDQFHPNPYAVSEHHLD